MYVSHRKNRIMRVNTDWLLLLASSVVTRLVADGIYCTRTYCVPATTQDVTCGLLPLFLFLPYLVSFSPFGTTYFCTRYYCCCVW